MISIQFFSLQWWEFQRSIELSKESDSRLLVFLKNYPKNVPDTPE